MEIILGKLGQIEQSRLKELKELKGTQDQNQLMRREYEFYRDLCEKLQSRQTDEVGTLSRQLVEAREAEKDSRLKMQLLERENQEASVQNLNLIQDLQRMQRDLKSILAVNEEYQH